MKTWKARISYPTGQVVVTVQAPNQHVARSMIEAKYGKGCILSGHVQQV